MHQKTPRISIRVGWEMGKIDGRQIAFLEAIQSQGSIRGASRLTGLSYPGALLVIRGINKALSEPAISAVKGGRKGGGAALTYIGIQLVQLYRAIEARLQAVALPEREELLRLAQPKKRAPKRSARLRSCCCNVTQVAKDRLPQGL
jgi:molybdate transport system regulatory protein